MLQVVQRAFAAALAVALASPSAAQPARAGTTTTTRDTTDPRAKHAEAMTADAEAAWTRPPVDEREATSRGTVAAVTGRPLAYTATAGTLTIRDDDSKPTASVFYTAYTLDGAARRARPVTFFYNGGPGSATVWLHMGSFAPVRVTTANPEYIRPAPYGFGPNPYTLLDKTDLVFIDAVGAGWSRPLGDKTGRDFNGVDQDADAFTRAIMRYTSKTGRWTSPKFLFGESYGTLRSGAVAAQLERRGMSLNGVVLLSSILNYGIRQPGFDQLDVTMLPSYAATAWYHNRVPDRPADLAAFVARARAFATGPYASALAKGASLGPDEMDRVAREMAALTGLSADYIKRAQLRVDLQRFQTELLRDKRVSVGRLDSRYTLAVSDANAAEPDEDPASTAIAGAFVASFQDYAAHTLGYKTDMPYKVSAREPGWDWDWKHRAPGDNYPQPAPDTAVDIASTMRTNPFLKVLSLNGYYDMATPFFGTEFDISHMLLGPELQKNVQFRYYPSGHMVYLNPAELAHMHADLAAWYDETVGAAVQGVPPARAAARRGSRAAATTPSR